jgi:hypothetical protein
MKKDSMIHARNQMDKIAKLFEIIPHRALTLSYDLIQLMNVYDSLADALPTIREYSKMGNLTQLEHEFIIFQAASFCMQNQIEANNNETKN